MADKDMIQITCDNCGKTYQIDADKLTEGKNVFTCKGCENEISVEKPAAGDGTLPPPSEEAQAPAAKPARRSREAAEEKPAKGRGMGLRGKMFLLFLVIPILLMALAGAFYMWQLNKMVDVFTDSSTQIVNRMASELMAQYSRKVALQVKRYLDDNPFLKKEEFNRDHGFKMVGTQKIGMTGFTAVYERPGDTGGSYRMWAHVEPDLIGIDMTDMRKQLGSGYDQFWKIVTGVAEGSSSQGTYAWNAEDGSRQENFIVCTPVPETPYVVLASTPASEFQRDVKRLQTKTGKVASSTRVFIAVILVATIILIGVIVATYGAHITGKLRELTDAADRISVGEMDTEIKVRSNDEIGDLADAISRMQESIRLSIDRLRRRRRK